MARRGHPIFEVIVDALSPAHGDLVVDLGCGRGPALHALIERQGLDLRLVGLDLSGESLDAVRAELPEVRVDVADLDQPLPFDDHSVDGVASHNVVECLTDPAAFFAEVRRVLRPDGRAVISHVDFDGIVISGPDRSLTRRVIHAYADHAPPWMQNADGQMGRQLAGLARDAGLDLLDVSIHVTSSSTLCGDAMARVDEIAAVLSSGVQDVAATDVARWRTEVDDADERGAFMFSEPCFVVTASPS